jgi:large subunit ribosomal protein L17
MHRHGYKGRKLQLAAGPRKALIRGQVTSLVLHEQITTTVAKAKEIAPYFERLVTKAKKGDLHNRRQIRSFLLTEKATEKLIAEIAPVFKERNGGYTRIVKLGNRLGDNAPMAAVMLTDKPEPTNEPKAAKKAAPKKAETKSVEAKNAAAQSAVKPTAKTAATKQATKSTARTSRRGDK